MTARKRAYLSETPTVGRFVDFALVSPRQVGDTLSVRTSTGTVPIRVAGKGLYDPDNECLRARPG